MNKYNCKYNTMKQSIHSFEHIPMVLQIQMGIFLLAAVAPKSSLVE